jgi:hypothetical protein
MLNFSASLKIHLHVAPVDMRKSFQGLTAIAKHEMKKNLADGSVFVFCNRSRPLVVLRIIKGQKLPVCSHLPSLIIPWSSRFSSCPPVSSIVLYHPHGFLQVTERATESRASPTSRSGWTHSSGTRQAYGRGAESACGSCAGCRVEGGVKAVATWRKQIPLPPGTTAAAGTIPS